MNLPRVHIFITLLLFVAVDVSAADGDGPVKQNIDEFSFGDEEEHEDKDISTSFECYDLTDDAERTICLNETLYLFDQQLKAAHSEKVSLALGKDTFFIVREFNQWLSARASTCVRDVECYLNLYKRKMTEVVDSPSIADFSFQPGEGRSVISVSFFGREATVGYYVNRIRFQSVHQGNQTVSSIYMLDFLDEKYWELLILDPRLNLMDANFDGFDDFVIFLGNQGRDGKKVAYLLFDPAKGSFYADRTLNSLNVSYFDDLHKLVHVEWQQDDNDSIFGTDFYGYDSRGRLKRAYRHSYVRFTDNDGSKKIKRIIYRSVGGRNAKIASDVIEPEQVGDMPDSMFRKPLSPDK